MRRAVGSFSTTHSTARGGPADVDPADMPERQVRERQLSCANQRALPFMGISGAGKAALQDPNSIQTCFRWLESGGEPWELFAYVWSPELRRQEYFRVQTTAGDIGSWKGWAWWLGTIIGGRGGSLGP